MSLIGEIQEALAGNRSQAESLAAAGRKVEIWKARNGKFAVEVSQHGFSFAKAGLGWSDVCLETSRFLELSLRQCRDALEQVAMDLAKAPTVRRLVVRDGPQAKLVESHSETPRDALGESSGPVGSRGLDRAAYIEALQHAWWVMGFDDVPGLTPLRRSTVQKIEAALNGLEGAIRAVGGELPSWDPYSKFL